MAETARPPRNETSVPIHDALAGRWSPRGFDPEYVVAEDDLTALGEAARWAPSASNLQPSHFIIVAVGKYTDADDLPEGVRERDAAPRTRRSLEELAIVLDA